MITIDKLLSISKSDIPEASTGLSVDDIPQLIEMLSFKEDNIRYQAFLLLQCRSRIFDDAYPYWNTFQEKLKSDNSYQRSIGLMLIAENVRWDTQNLMDGTIEEYLSHLNDEKPITIRQCIQSLALVAQFKPNLSMRIAERLIAFDLKAVKETMRKSILLDILQVLLVIRKESRTEEVESYIMNALVKETLDKKSKKQIELELLL